jgi:hypothetical protein
MHRPLGERGDDEGANLSPADRAVAADPEEVTEAGRMIASPMPEAAAELRAELAAHVVAVGVAARSSAGFVVVEHRRRFLERAVSV